MKQSFHSRIAAELILASKVAIGSSAAICIAELLNLEFATSAGIITLLTVMATKVDTFKLSLLRFITFTLSSLLSWLIFQWISSDMVSYGLFIFIVVVMCCEMGWKSTISVNAVVGTHFLTQRDFSAAFFLNELLLVTIGITIAIVLNLFQHNSLLKTRLKHSINYTEKQLQLILKELGKYLRLATMTRSVWDDIIALEKKIQEFLVLAYEYRDNSFRAHTDYYVNYFEMREKQCASLHNLHYEIKKIRSFPHQAKVVADYILYLEQYVTEMNDPTQQLERLARLFAEMREQALPQTREEFETRAMLYHILMDLEEFLTYKRRFLEALDSSHIHHYHT